VDNEYTIVTVRLLLALIAGGVIGMERTYHGRPAGFRTHTLVCTASSLLMLLVVYQWRLISTAPIETLRVDPTRMAQGIMTGIGFLGAGVIMKERFTVRGLTTAASIWITASIGIIIGMGFYFAAALASVLTLGTLSLFRWLESHLPMFHYGRLMIRCRGGERITEQSLYELIGSHDINGGSFSYHRANESNTVQYQLSIHTRDISNFSRLADALGQMKGVAEFSIIQSAS
jgi:putative Mg2+ transporter-C (MgtC) family protein